MPSPIEFGVYDPREDVAVSERNLPHWFQHGVATFITFRTADSLPAEVLARWEREQTDWLARSVARLFESGAATFSPDHTTSVNSFTETSQPIVPPQLQREFQQLRWQAWHGHLDACHGACVLRRPELVKIVAEALCIFDGQRYDLDCFVIMPNHVHLLVQFRLGIDPRRQCGNWQRFTARRINELLQRRGAFWQSEPFDHLVRSPEQFTYLQHYIAQNPVKADLSPGSYLYWQRRKSES